MPFFQTEATIEGIRTTISMTVTVVAISSTASTITISTINTISTNIARIVVAGR